MKVTSVYKKPLYILFLTCIIILAYLTIRYSYKKVPSEPSISSSSSSFVIPVTDYSMDLNFVQSILKRFTQSEHVFGSREQEKLKDYILETISGYSDQTYVQTFSVKTPVYKKPGAYEFKTGRNIISKAQSIPSSSAFNNSTSCSILVGSHYDTKKVDSGCLGANDSGSSSALLMDYLRYFSTHPTNTKCQIYFIWFDGEESVLDDWNDWKEFKDLGVDNTYGSRYFVSKLKKCPDSKYSGYCLDTSDTSNSFNSQSSTSTLSNHASNEIVAFVLFDMIASLNLNLSRDLNSDTKLQNAFSFFWNKLHGSTIYQAPYQDIEDDHTPFVKKGIKSIDIIDLNNLSFWHNDKDTIDNLSFQNMEKVAQAGINFLVWLADNPEKI